MDVEMFWVHLVMMCLYPYVYIIRCSMAEIDSGAAIMHMLKHSLDWQIEWSDL